MCTTLEKQVGGNTKTTVPKPQQKGVDVFQGW